VLKTLYTIGYSGFNVDDFVDILKKYGINVLIDVRSNPFSAYFSAFNKEQLENTLKSKHIFYRNYAKEFGAQQPERSFYTPQGYLDFEKFTTSQVFNEGYHKIENGLKQDYIFAFMCAEKDPIDCHRSIMISKTFKDNGYTVLHLLPNINPISQVDIEDRLLNKYFPDRDQLSLFDERKSDSNLISEAYKKRNADIGYHIEESQHDNIYNWIY